MSFFSLLLAVFIFFVGALAPIFNWNLGDFSPLYWGLGFFALSFLIPGVVAYARTVRRP